MEDIIIDCMFDAYNSGINPVYPTSTFVILSREGMMSFSMFDLAESLLDNPVNSVIFCGELVSFKEQLEWVFPYLAGNGKYIQLLDKAGSKAMDISAHGYITIVNANSIKPGQIPRINASERDCVVCVAENVSHISFIISKILSNDKSSPRFMYIPKYLKDGVLIEDVIGNLPYVYQFNIENTKFNEYLDNLCI